MNVAKGLINNPAHNKLNNSYRYSKLILGVGILLLSIYLIYFPVLCVKLILLNGWCLQYNEHTMEEPYISSAIHPSKGLV